MKHFVTDEDVKNDVNYMATHAGTTIMYFLPNVDVKKELNAQIRGLLEDFKPRFVKKTTSNDTVIECRNKSMIWLIAGESDDCIET